MDKSSCPAPEALRAFSVGTIADEKIDAVADHVVGCNSSGGVAAAIELALSFLVGNG